MKRLVEVDIPEGDECRYDNWNLCQGYKSGAGDDKVCAYYFEGNGLRVILGTPHANLMTKRYVYPKCPQCIEDGKRESLVPVDTIFKPLESAFGPSLLESGGFNKKGKGNG